MGEEKGPNTNSECDTEALRLGNCLLLWNASPSPDPSRKWPGGGEWCSSWPPEQPKKLALTFSVLLDQFPKTSEDGKQAL